MTVRYKSRCRLILAVAGLFLAGVSVAQTPAAPTGITSKRLIQEPLGELSDPKMSLFILSLAAGASVPSHSHAGAVFAYILEGDIENQVDPDPPGVFHSGDFFHERPKQVHRLLRNVSPTAPAKLLIFQNTGTLPPTVNPLLQQPLANLANLEVSVITMVAAPGAAVASAHQHPGPVFAYVVKGEIETQIDPDGPKSYQAGDVFYETPMHAHRGFRNTSATDPAELVLFEVVEKGQPLAMGVAK